MSPSTHSFAPERRTAWHSLKLACACILAFGIGSSTFAVTVPPLPQAIAEVAPNLQLQGGGEMRFFGIPIYDGWYWSAKAGWALDHAFALDLQYLRSLDGEKIADRSVEEIARVGYGTVERRMTWLSEMKRVFPDVKKGDRVTGLHLPGQPVRFFLNGTPIGEIADPEFAHAFFAIWFDPKTSRGDFRKKLLGLK